MTTSTSSFNNEELSFLFFNQNKEALTRYRQVTEICAKDPILRNDPADYGKSRQELYEIYARKLYRFHKLLTYDESSADIAITCFPEQLNTVMNIKMFMPTIKYLGTEKQFEKWYPRAQSFEIIGCYAQTELAHGSDVQNLQLQAIYDVEKEEFELWSPSIKASKWWIGDLGLTATHCVTQAQLVIKGKQYGVQTFIVPIRDNQTFQVYEGIRVGDIGPKYGYNNKDNGFLMFDRIRIPRENMLMRYAKVSKSGEFTKAQNEKIAYATMMVVRTSIIKSSYATLGIGVTIAVRYSHKRKQFKNDEGIERPIIDYQVQMDKILPLLADCYAQCFGSHRIEWLTGENVRRVQEKMDFSLMNDLHALQSCCKAVYTWNTHFGLDKLRQSCGGHGFLQYSRFPSLITEFAPTCTYEGENTVLLLQCARYLLKALSKASKRQAVNENVEYLVNIDQTLSQKSNIERVTQLFCPDIVRKILRYNAAWQVQQAGIKLMTSIAEKEVGQKEAWDYHGGIALVDASIAHNYYWTMKNFQDWIVNAKDENLRTVLARLCCLYGVTRILERSNGYFESGYLRGEQLQLFFDAKEMLLEQIKPDALALVNAFQYNDNQLFSALIQPDPYQTLFDWASKSNNINQVEVQKEIYNGFKKEIGNVPQPKL